MNPELQQRLITLDEEYENIFLSIQNLDEAQVHDQSYGWSLIQVLSHLETSEAGTIIYMKKKMLAGPDKIPEFGLGNKLRLWLTKSLLTTSLKWKAPKNVSNPRSEYTLEAIRGKWDKTREDTKNYISEYPAELMPKAIFKHPMAGRIDLVGALDSMIYHQRHHVFQIDRIKKSIGFRQS